MVKGKQTEERRCLSYITIHVQSEAIELIEFTSDDKKDGRNHASLVYTCLSCLLPLVAPHSAPTPFPTAYLAYLFTFFSVSFRFVSSSLVLLSLILFLLLSIETELLWFAYHERRLFTGTLLFQNPGNAQPRRPGIIIITNAPTKT